MTDEGYDALVDRLMSMEGYDRDEAEMLATASLTAGEKIPDGCGGRQKQSLSASADRTNAVTPSSPAVSDVRPFHADMDEEDLAILELDSGAVSDVPAEEGK